MNTELKKNEQPAGKMTIKDYLNNPGMIAQIQRALPKHMSADRMARIALTCLNRVPKLRDCSQESFFKCLLDLSALGLEPDGRHAHIIPYGRDATLVIDYKGIVVLAYRSGCVKSIHCDVVRTGDIFEYDLGEIKRHVPYGLRMDKDKPESAGEIFAVYAIIHLRDDAMKCEVMSVADVEKVRRSSKTPNAGPWKDWWDEMAKKSVFRRAAKWIPLSAEVMDAFDRDENMTVDEDKSQHDTKEWFTSEGDIPLPDDIEVH